MTDTFLKNTKLQSDARRTTVNDSVVTQEMYFWIATNLSKQQDGGSHERSPNGGLDACISECFLCILLRFSGYRG